MADLRTEQQIMQLQKETRQLRDGERELTQRVTTLEEKLEQFIQLVQSGGTGTKHDG